jgi:hypothetical protein
MACCQAALAPSASPWSSSSFPRLNSARGAWSGWPLYITKSRWRQRNSSPLAWRGTPKEQARLACAVEDLALRFPRLNSARGAWSGDRDGGAFFPFGEDLEQQFGAAPVQLEIAQLVQAQKIDAAVAGDGPGQGLVVGG